MSQPTRPFRPYRSPDELGRGRRKMLVSLALALSAVLLAVIAQHAAGDGRLVTLYLSAGVIWFVSALAEAVRWSNTREFEPAD